MTAQDKTEVKEMLQNIISGYKATVESQYDLINRDLKSLKNHNERQNGTIQHHQRAIVELGERARDIEEDIRTHPVVCPVAGKMDVLESLDVDKRLKNIEDYFMKRFGFWEYLKNVSAVIIALLTVISLGYGIYTLIN